MSDKSTAPTEARASNPDRTLAVRAIWDWYPTVEIAPIGVFRTTPDGRFSYVNRELANILEFDSAKEMVEKVADIATEILVRPEQRDHFKTVLKTNGFVCGFIYDVKTRQGRLR